MLRLRIREDERKFKPFFLKVFFSFSVAREQLSTFNFEYPSECAMYSACITYHSQILNLAHVNKQTMGIRISIKDLNEYIQTSLSQSVFKLKLVYIQALLRICRSLACTKVERTFILTKL